MIRYSNYFKSPNQITGIEITSACIMHDEEAPLLNSDTISVCSSHVEPHFAGAEIVRDVIIG